METYVLLFSMATMGAFIAGYSIASEKKKEYAQAFQDRTAEVIRLREQLAALRKSTACACGLHSHHTGKHAPHAYYSESPAMRELARSLSAQPKITSNRIPKLPAKESTKPKAIHRTMSRQKKS